MNSVWEPKGVKTYEVTYWKGGEKRKAFVRTRGEDTARRVVAKNAGIKESAIDSVEEYGK